MAGGPAARASGAPVWPMEAFRDRFLGAFSSPPRAPTTSPGATGGELTLRPRLRSTRSTRCAGPPSRRASSWASRAWCRRARSAPWPGPPASVRGCRCSTCAAASAGPGSLLVTELGCTYLGVDADPAAVGAGTRARGAPAGPALASRSAGCLRCRTGGSTSCCSSRPCSRSPTSRALLAEISSVLPVGGRFACTVEEGAPLTEEERLRMPRADTVWPVPSAQLRNRPRGRRAARPLAG